MTRCFLGTFCALLLMAGAGWAGSPTAAYVGGTITAIPGNAQGTLDLGAPDAIYFRYGAADYSIPFGDITGYHLGRDNQGFAASVAGGAAKVGRTVLPMFFSSKKFLTLEVRPMGVTKTETLVFELPSDEAKAALPVLQARVTPTLLESPVADPTVTRRREPTRDMYGVGSWWGDTVWRTNRNKDLWPRRPEESGDKPLAVATSQDE